MGASRCPKASSPSPPVPAFRVSAPPASIRKPPHCAERAGRLPRRAPAPADDPAAEQRYKVLQGKYNAEVPRLQAQFKEPAARFSGDAEPARVDAGHLGGHGTAAAGPQFGPAATATESRNT